MSEIKSLKEAEAIYKKAHPNDRLISVVECSGYYVFNGIDKNLPDGAEIASVKPLRAVIKKDGRIMTYNPIVVRDPEYREATKRNIKYY